LRRRANPTSNRKMTSPFNHWGPNNLSSSFTFLQFDKKPPMDKRETATPAQRPINPGPGPAKVPT
jgi:hypothetical protein